MIATWLTGKLSGIIIFVLACLSIPLGIAAGVQTVRLDGISLFGWHLIDGAIYAEQQAESARDAALKDLGTCQSNERTLQASIAMQNGAIHDLGIKTTEAEAKANAALDDVAAKSKQMAALEQKIMAAKPGADQCKSADALILENLQ